MTRISKKTALRVLLLLGILAGCIVDRSSILRYQAQIEDRKSEAIALQETTSLEVRRNEALGVESELAMNRARSGCRSVNLIANGKPARLNEKSRIIDPSTLPKNPKTPFEDMKGSLINGVQPLPKGLTVCNVEGDTAIVGEGGYVEKIARVEPSKLKDFRSLVR